MLRILAPTDFSTDGYNATLVALQLGKALNAEVTFVHAMAKPPVPANAPEGLYLSLYKEEERVTRDRLLEETKHLFDILDLRHGEVLYKTLVVPTPFTEAMLQVIAREQIDMVVMGSRGSSNLKQILIGSNTLELMRLSPVPLLVMPSDVVFNGFKNITILLEQTLQTARHGIDLIERIARFYEASLHFLVLKKDGQLVQDINQLQLDPEVWHYLLLQPCDLTMVADTDALNAMVRQMASTQNNLLVLLPEKQSMWESLFSKNITEELTARALLPLLILPLKR